MPCSGTQPNGLHHCSVISEDEWLSKVYDASDAEVRLLPLPPLAPPMKPISMKSDRIRRRYRDRLVVWRIAVGIAAASGSLYGSRHQRPFLPMPSIALREMATLHQKAWHAFILEASRLREARRLFGATGAAAVEEVVRVPADEYMTSGPTMGRYVPLVSSKIAEPSTPRFVAMLDALPPELRDFYAHEHNVLQDGGTDPIEIDSLDLLGQTLGGPYPEYVKYMNRLDVDPLWS